MLCSWLHNSTSAGIPSTDALLLEAEWKITRTSQKVEMHKLSGSQPLVNARLHLLHTMSASNTAHLES